MPALETSINLEVKQIKSEETWKTQLVNGGAADVSLNSLHRLNGSDDANAMKPDRLVETQAEATGVPASNCEKVVSNGQLIVTPLRAESHAVQNSNNQTLTPNNCNPPVIVSKTPISAALSLSTPKTAVAPVVMSAHITNGSSTVQSAVSNPVPKIIMNAGQTGTSSPVVAANNVIQVSSSPTCVSTLPSTCGQAKVEVSLAPSAQAGVAAVTAPQTPKVTRVATITQTPGKGTVIALPRPSTPQPNGAPRTPQTTSVQLPANFQIPQGMVLIRSDSGQLMLVSQQALAQAQAQGIIPRVNAGARAPATPGASQATAVIRNAEVTPVIKVPPPPASGKPVTSFQKMTVLKATGGAVSTTVGQAVRPAVSAVITTVSSVSPAKAEAPKATSTTTISAETLENVKKCKNFLVTLIKLASGGTHSAEMAKNVKELVKSLLDGKIEAEEFTDRLYTELKSSPQPYLVPFLKRSLPAVRQLTPNSQLFIEQCGLPKPPPAPPQGAKAAPAALPGLSRPTQPGLVTALARRPAQTPSSSHLVIQQPRGVVMKQALTSGPSHFSLSAQNRTLPKQFVTTIQSASRATGTIINQSPIQVSKIITMQPSVVQRNCFKDGAPTSFREEDDINDVASMAGVNLSEESARILATNSELVGSVIRSCRDEPFIAPAVLHKRLLETGKRHGVTDFSSDAVSLLSHATQERLRELLEKLTVVAQHRKISFKDDYRHRQSSDTRAQLKFLEQLDRLEKQRKDGEEREILLRVAKSRSNREDPEQLRLKQKAKEMQQLELAQTQQRDANLTALAAIGPRKKRPLDTWGGGSGNEVALGSGPGVLKQASVQRITRVGLKDLLFCMEQDPTLRHTLSLYTALLR
ncbi:transcription initiation factor TFIID subunit 4-like isoform X2 [Conger conger]|uniref:transcription initiation factor TFIID subunit 4-like isoform X2 n=1 Tax=Conger conger TaxID=82655 RepID=UPI002A5AFBE8|nr:transcription initiation factor TFIID subunit 4-like isoform X2 [Conger conger]